jgi:4-amino-4-deoxy-L-arabinose transferase-like glycosyltransferase
MVPNVRWRWPVTIFILLIGCLCCFYRIFNYPTSTWFDPAYNGLDALRLIQRGGLVIFFPTNGGREALFIYLLAPIVWIFGATTFSMRLLTAALGLIHIALLFGFLYELPSFLPQGHALTNLWQRTRLWTAAMAAIILATSYWHISITRRGQRPILVPIVAVLLFWLVLKARHSGQRKWFVLAGIALGLSGYTYGAARLLPLILLLVFLPQMVQWLFGALRRYSSHHLTPVRIPWVNIAWFLLAAVLVYLPIGMYFLGHQAQFTSRAGSVMVWSFLTDPKSIAAELIRNVQRVLCFFCCLGNPSFGPADFPGFNPFLLPFLAIGLITAAFNVRDLIHRLLLLWWGIGLIPSVAAIEAPHPYRMIVSLTPSAILVVLAVNSGCQWLRSRERNDVARTIGRVLPRFVVALTILWLPFVYWSYFVRWDTLATSQGMNDRKSIALHTAIIDHISSGLPVYVPMTSLNNSTLLFFLSGSFSRSAKMSIPLDEEALAAYFIAPRQEVDDSTWVRLYGDSALILPPLIPQTQRLIQESLRQGDTEVFYANDGTIAGYGARLATDPGRQVQTPTSLLEVPFGPVRLIGAHYSDVLHITDKNPCVPVTLFWQADQPIQTEYEILVRLVGDDLRSWGNGDGRPNGWVYPTSFWQPGVDTIAATHCVSIDSELPPLGRYWLSISVYDPATGSRLTVRQEDSSIRDTFLLGPVKVPLPPVTSFELADMMPPKAVFGDEIMLESVRIQQTDDQRTVSVSLLWQAIEHPQKDYTVFLHLINTNGDFAFGHDTQPVQNSYPTTIWQPGEYVLDTHVLELPEVDQVPAGVYTLVLGLYDVTTGKRLPIQSAIGTVRDGDGLVVDANLQIR